MGYRAVQYQENTQYGVNSYIVDTYTDLATIPIDDCAPGSTCLVIDTSENYMLNNANSWVKVQLGGGGGGGDVSNKMDKNNPTGTGYLSLNRKENTTVGENSVAVGSSCTASGARSFACGASSEATGNNSHAEGDHCYAINYNAHAEGNYSTASGNVSHAEGFHTQAKTSYSHSEGSYTVVNANVGHAEGSYCEVKGLGTYGHAEGDHCQVQGSAAHAEGSYCQANVQNSHAEGSYSVANGPNQHVMGRYNALDNNGDYAFIIGNGSSEAYRHNALTVNWDGIVHRDVWTLINSETQISLTETLRKHIANQDHANRYEFYIQIQNANSENDLPSKPFPQLFYFCPAYETIKHVSICVDTVNTLSFTPPTYNKCDISFYLEDSSRLSVGGIDLGTGITEIYLDVKVWAKPLELNLPTT